MPVGGSSGVGGSGSKSSSTGSSGSSSRGGGVGSSSSGKSRSRDSQGRSGGGINSADKGGRVGSRSNEGGVASGGKGSRVGRSTNDNVSLSPESQSDPKTQEKADKKAKEVADNFESRFNASADAPQTPQDGLADALEAKADEMRQTADTAPEEQTQQVADALDDKADQVRTEGMVNDAAADTKTVGRAAGANLDKYSSLQAADSLGQRASLRAGKSLAASGLAGSAVQGVNSARAAVDHFSNGDVLNGVAQTTSAISDATDIAADFDSTTPVGGRFNTVGGAITTAARSANRAGNVAKLAEAGTEFAEGKYFEAAGTALVAGGGLVAENSKALAGLAGKAAPVIGGVEAAATIADPEQAFADRFAAGMKIGALGVTAFGAATGVGAAPGALIGAGLQTGAMAIENRALIGQGIQAVGHAMFDGLGTREFENASAREIQEHSMRELQRTVAREQWSVDFTPQGSPVVDISLW